MNCRSTFQALADKSLKIGYNHALILERSYSAPVVCDCGIASAYVEVFHSGIGKYYKDIGLYILILSFNTN